MIFQICERLLTHLKRRLMPKNPLQPTVRPNAAILESFITLSYLLESECIFNFKF